MLIERETLDALLGGELRWCCEAISNRGDNGQDLASIHTLVCRIAVQFCCEVKGDVLE